MLSAPYNKELQVSTPAYSSDTCLTLGTWCKQQKEGRVGPGFKLRCLGCALLL